MTELFPELWLPTITENHQTDLTADPAKGQKKIKLKHEQRLNLMLWIRKYFFRIRIRNPQLRIRIPEAN
jgi:hypothetical protein